MGADGVRPGRRRRRDQGRAGVGRHPSRAGGGVRVVPRAQPELLELCTAWQIRSVDGVLNDHTDTAYDARVLALFADLHARAVVVIAALAAAAPRFARYDARLSEALARVRAGELDRLADTIDSFHAIWAELHEDLLATLGIARWTG